MLFNVATVTLVGVLAFFPSALATITITGPGPSAYWVQNVSNEITWQYNQGDPNPIAITVTNPNNTFLNGPFSIAENVDLSNKSFTVTNVTLNVHSGYVVNFVNGSNLTHVFAQSQPFDLKAPGTPQVPPSTPSGSSPAATATSPSKNGTATSSGASATAKTSTAMGSFSDVAPALVVGVAFTLFGALATF